MAFQLDGVGRTIVGVLELSSSLGRVNSSDSTGAALTVKFMSDAGAPVRSHTVELIACALVSASAWIEYAPKPRKGNCPRASTWPPAETPKQPPG